MKNVLVIDDNPSIVDIIRYILMPVDAYHVVAAYDGVQGLACVYAEKPDCIIVDVRMPRMDGYHLMRCLRGDPHTADIPMIILSAMTREKDLIAGSLSGGDEYITKPFELSELEAAIERVLCLTSTDRMGRMEYLVQVHAERED